MLVHRNIFLCVFVLLFQSSFQRAWVTTDEFENNISPEDLKEFLKFKEDVTTTTEADADYASVNVPKREELVPHNVACHGLGSVTTQIFQRVFNMKPASSEIVKTEFYFTSKNQVYWSQVFAGDQFGLEWVDFKPERKTVMIVHGFMSYGNASWVKNMANAFLRWSDVNVIVVDWSGGGNTWMYWKAVANTRRVGSDITDFLQQLMNATGARAKDFHFVGHSLGAHICSYVSFHMGPVARITGLDPAQPCFHNANSTERLDPSDAHFVDVIHTNGRLSSIGFGLPEPMGHADFYPNGGMHQPGCFNTSSSILSRLPTGIPLALEEAICSHGRAYHLFTESLNNNCSFRSYQWNLTYESINASIKATCDRVGSCSEMGIRAIGIDGLPRAQGNYFTLTSGKAPYCPTESERMHPRPELLRDLSGGLRLDRAIKETTTTTAAYADPDGEINAESVATTTTPRCYWKNLWCLKINFSI